MGVQQHLPYPILTLPSRVVTFLSESFSWSALTTIGQSPFVRLTIVMPFVGYILLFNTHLQDYLSISRDHASDLFPGNNSGEIAEQITINRLNFLYFGLVFVGLASSLYALFSPREIKNHPLPADYINYTSPVATDNLTRTAFERVLSAFMAADTAEERSPLSALASRSFPDIAAQRLHSFVRAIYVKTEFGFEQSEDDPSSGEEVFSEIRSGSGYLLTDVLIEKLWANRRMEWALTEPMFAMAMDYKKDVFYIEHLTLDYSRFGLRCTVAFLYGIGFALLLIPTIETTIRLAVNWLWR
jgi:hypothetical protein